MRTLIKTTTYCFLLSIFIFACKHKNQNAISVADEFQKKSPPNIIVILLDDAGYADFGFMGSQDLETPHIDQLAKEGIIFTDAHVSATVCAPSRAGLITGKYQQRFGFEANHTGDKESGDLGLADNVLTLADILKKHNYSTTAIGKWHLGASKEDHPNQRGFDDFYGFLSGGRSYFPLKNPNEKRMLQHNGERVCFDGYLTDVLGDYSVNYAEEHAKHPFFMYLAYNAVHTPMHAKEEDLERYKDHPRKQLAAMTWSLDQNIGKLREKLKELNLLDNTLIFFLSDNGGATNNQSSNRELKGWKGNKFEGGHRVPFVVSWPNTLPFGKTYDGLTSSLDIFATSIAAANVKEPSLQLDGVNLIPHLNGNIKEEPHQELYWRKLEEAAVRIEDKKLIRLEGFGHVLYDLEDDIKESKDLSQDNREETVKLLQKLEQWESQISPSLWKEEKEWMEITKHIHQRLMENKKVLYKSPKQRKKFLRNKS